MRKVFEFGGFIAGAVLIIFGVAVIALGVSARSTVHHDLSQEAIVGSSDMSPSAIKEEIAGESWAASVDIPTLDGKVTLKVPPGSRSGQKLRVRGKGLPRPKDGEPGDLYALLQIAVPGAVSEHEKELYRQLAEASSFNPRAHFE